MASVTGKTSIKIDDLINDTIVDGQIVSGHLILRNRAGAEIDAGVLTSGGGGSGVTDHGALTGLADDDHPQYLTAAEGNAAYAPIGSGGGTTVVNAPFLTVASSSLPTAVKDACNYQCDGTADQFQINNALERASRINDGFPTAEGWAAVVLVGDRFSVNNPVTMYPSTKLTGGGDGTLIESAYSIGDVRGIIELKNQLVARCTVSDLSIGSPDGNTFNGSGIKFDMTGDLAGYTYDFPTGGDAYVKIHRVGIYNPVERGIWLIDGREAQIDNIHIQNARKQGLFVDNHTDVKISRVVANGTAGTEAGIEITGGNGQLTDSKVFYRGNKSDGIGPTGTPQHGFKINTSRMTIADCQAQDNGGYGFYIEGSDHSVTNCMADSNSAQGATYGGFYIAASGSYSGLVACHRPNNFINQNRGIVFSGAPQVSLSARVSVESGSNHVVGTPGANSSVQVVRNGTTIYSVGGASVSPLDFMPVGFIYTSVVATSPDVLFGGGTWTRIGQGRVLVGQDPAQTEFDTAEEIGGEKTHTLTVGELPPHTHVIIRKAGSSTSTGVARGSSTATADGTTETAGSGEAHNNLQPYLVVFMWKRVA